MFCRGLLSLTAITSEAFSMAKKNFPASSRFTVKNILKLDRGQLGTENFEMCASLNAARRFS